MIQTLERPSLIESNYQCTIVKTLEEFKALKPFWNGFLEEAGEANINLSYDWLLTWLEHFPPLSLFTILVRDTTGDIIAIAPLKISSSPSGLACRLLRRLQFIGTDPTVYDTIGIIYRSGENEEQIMRIITKQILLAQHQWDLIDLRYLQSREQAELLSDFIAPHNFGGELLSTMSNPYLVLPSTLNEYEATRKKNLKKNIRNILNRIKQDYAIESPIVEFFPPSPQYDQFMDTFIQGHIEHWASRTSRSDFARFPKLGSFYKTVHSVYNSQDNCHQQSLFSVLKLGPEAVSYQVCFWYGEQFLGHLTAFDPSYKKYSPGLIHTEALIQETLVRGGKAFNFGRGDEAYKTQWTETFSPLWDVLFFKSRWAYLHWQGDTILKNII